MLNLRKVITFSNLYIFSNLLKKTKTRCQKRADVRKPYSDKRLGLFSTQPYLADIRPMNRKSA